MGVRRSAVVVGAGIGGLAAAGALAAAGWQVVVLERSHDVRALGSGLALWKNALTALDHLTPELGAELRNRPRVWGQAGLRRPDGRWLLRVDPDARDADLLPVMVKRPELFAGLRATVPADAFRFGRTATAVDAGRVRVTKRSGEQEEYAADLVVAADGMGSRLRAAVDDRSRSASAGYVAWRGVVPAEAAEAFGRLDGGETWGRGQRFGMSRLSDGGIYWYATLADADPRAIHLDRSAPGDGQDGGNVPPGERQRLPALFAGWHAPIAPLIEATPADLLLRHGSPMLWPLPRTYASGPVVLLGDAAHGMTPDLGQGACLALEDAVELAEAVRWATPAEVPTALLRYDTTRRPRTTKLARQSRLMSRIGQARHPVAVGLRDRLARLVPPKVALRGLDDVLGWRPTLSAEDAEDPNR